MVKFLSKPKSLSASADIQDTKDERKKRNLYHFKKMHENWWKKINIFPETSSKSKQFETNSVTDDVVCDRCLESYNCVDKPKNKSTTADHSIIPIQQPNASLKPCEDYQERKRWLCGHRCLWQKAGRGSLRPERKLHLNARQTEMRLSRWLHQEPDYRLLWR